MNNDFEKITTKEFNSILRAAMNDGSSLPIGQAFYSELLHRHPDIAIEITGTDVDPFYGDENFFELMEKICIKE
jgi:hypothetical protein